MKNLIFAAIDIGSYNCRLTIVKKINYSFKIIHNFSYGTNLIRNLTFNNEFNDKNIEKTLKCLKKFSEKLIKFKVCNYRCIATEACRQVINPEFFINKVKKETGISVEVISSYEEAKLSLKSCEKYFKKIKNRGIIFDIGGGSTELTFFDFKKKIFSSKSISFGVINLSEKEDIYGKEVVSKQIKDHFNFFFKNSLLKFLNFEFMSIGSCSTVTTLCAIHKKLDYFDLNKIEGHLMNKNQLLDSMNFIKNLQVKDLKKISCIGSRYKLLLNGIVILKIILDIIPINKVIVSQNGLREGMLRDLLFANEKN